MIICKEGERFRGALYFCIQLIAEKKILGEKSEEKWGYVELRGFVPSVPKSFTTSYSGINCPSDTSLSCAP